MVKSGVVEVGFMRSTHFVMAQIITILAHSYFLRFDYHARPMVLWQSTNLIQKCQSMSITDSLNSQLKLSVMS